MPIDALLYLFEAYWPFVAGAALVGLATGWLSVSRKRRAP